MRFSLFKNILQIKIPVTRKLQIPERVLSCVKSSAFYDTKSSLNTAKSFLVKILPFNCPSSLETKKVVSDFLSDCF